MPGCKANKKEGEEEEEEDRGGIDNTKKGLWGLGDRGCWVPDRARRMDMGVGVGVGHGPWAMGHGPKCKIGCPSARLARAGSHTINSIRMVLHCRASSGLRRPCAGLFAGLLRGPSAGTSGGDPERLACWSAGLLGWVKTRERPHVLDAMSCTRALIFKGPGQPLTSCRADVLTSRSAPGSQNRGQG